MAIKYLRPMPALIQAPLKRQIRREFGAFVEPFLLHTPCPPLLAGAWMVAREVELVGRVPRPLKEAVAVAVSRLNQCPYCVDAHTVMLHATGAHAAAVQLRATSGSDVTDPTLHAISAWAAATRSPGAPTLRHPPFGPHAAPELLGTAVFYHYINRMVSVLLGQSPLPPTPTGLRGLTTRMAGWWFAQAARRPKVPGAALHFLPPAALPADLVWAEPAPFIAAAFARFTAVVTTAGEMALDPAVRALAAPIIAQWQGEAPGLGRAWLETAVAPLSAALRPAGRLVLLTALAPYQVDAPIVEAFRAQWPTDATLVAALAWASLTAARRVGMWLADFRF